MQEQYIGKIIFLCAVARPRLLPDGTWWDGKIGTWPFTEQIAANVPVLIEETRYEELVAKGALQYPIFLRMMRIFCLVHRYKVVTENSQSAS